MRRNGELYDDYEKIGHFSYSGTGVNGNSSIPTDRLPVGLRTSWDFYTAIFLERFKLTDVELFYDKASDIVAEREDADRAGSALSNGGQTTRDLRCDPGFVMTGLWIQADHSAGGSSQAEIHGVRIECSRLKSFSFVSR